MIGMKIFAKSKTTHISNEFSSFYVKVIRCCFDLFSHDLNKRLEHDAQYDLYVREMTLCVTFFARLCPGPFGHLGRSLVTRSAKAAQGFRYGSDQGPFGRPTSPKDAFRT